MALDNILTVLGGNHGDCFKPTRLQEDVWGFSTPTTTLQQLASAAHNSSRSRDRSPEPAGASYVLKLESSHTFISNHCVASMAEQYGVSDLTGSLAGTMLANKLPTAAEADAAVQCIRQHIDGAWSAEAVRRGVGYAKAGDYQQAMGCYDKAIDLNPSNCDAYVARGAAHANQKRFDAALSDFQAALQLDATNANAAKYMQATKDHMAAAAAAAPAAAAAGRLGAAKAEDTPAADRRTTAAGAAGASKHQDWVQQQPRQQLQQQQQLDKHNHRASKHRGRSRSSGNSDSSSSDDSSSSSLGSDSDGADGHPSKVQKRPTVSDIKEAIEVLRSAKKPSKQESSHHRDSGSSKKKKMKRHKHKHSSRSKHSKHRSKHKHKRKH